MHDASHYIMGYFGVCVCVFFLISCQVQPTSNTEQRVCVRLHKYTLTTTQGLRWTVYLSVQGKTFSDVPHGTQKQLKLLDTHRW